MSYNPFSLEGKTILVTGASSGIGQATAIECSKLGAKLVITGRNPERLQETMSRLEGEGHIQLLADLTNADDVKRLVAEILTLDGVVLCAGKGVTLPLTFASQEKYCQLLEVNFFAPMEVLRQLVRSKKLSKGGSVVLISSVGGILTFNPGNGIYGVSKAALDSAKKFWAVELSTKKIRVNSINPGMVETKLIHGGTFTQEQLAVDAAKYPLGRFGHPEEIAYGVIYLLSDAAAWITGHSLVIDGGVSI